MTKWEYKLHTYCPWAGRCDALAPVDRRPLRKILAELGEEGWELVMKEDAGQCAGGGAHEELTFKRPLEIEASIPNTIRMLGLGSVTP